MRLELRDGVALAYGVGVVSIPSGVWMRLELKVVSLNAQEFLVSIPSGVWMRLELLGKLPQRLYPSFQSLVGFG